MDADVPQRARLGGMKLSPLKRFLLAALAWLPACFALWWWVSGLTVKVPVWLAGLALTNFWPDLVAGVSQGFDNGGMPTMDVLTRIAVSEAGPDGRMATGYLEATVRPLLYGYSLPLFFGLCLATPQDARDLMTALRQLKLPRHVPVLRTPLPTDITCVVPEVIVNVNHAGWTKGGLMREGQVVKWWRFSEAPADLPPATAHGPPGHSPVKKHR